MKPTVYIADEAFRKLELYIEHATGEISGLGAVEELKDALLITDLILLKQESSGSETELDDDAVAQLISDSEHPEVFKLWWHSHASMSAMWSTTDADTIEKFSAEYLISIVGNKKGEYETRVDVFSPVHVSCEADLLVMRDGNEKLAKTIKAEIKDKVRAKTYVQKGKQLQTNSGTKDDKPLVYQDGSYFDTVTQTWCQARWSAQQQGWTIPDIPVLCRHTIY